MDDVECVRIHLERGHPARSVDAIEALPTDAKNAGGTPALSVNERAPVLIARIEGDYQDQKDRLGLLRRTRYVGHVALVD